MSIQQRAILTLLPKPEKRFMILLQNWRPLSLLNMDYKILTKLLANRLQKVHPCIVSEDQVGYIKGRFIGENIRKIIDIFETTVGRISPGIALFLDFEKAFDTVSWKFLMKTLKTFNFGPCFIKWIKILYNQPLCCTCNNGYSSQFFEISRGIRQGCPISALLFILVAEIMAINIRNANNIKGLDINGCIITITQMADDTALFLKNMDSVKYSLQLLDHFFSCAGLKLNKEKTEAVKLGVGNKGDLSVHGIKWVENKIRSLGIWVGNDMGELTIVNLEERVQKIRNLINMWKSRNLTIKGKVTLLQTQALPQLLYIASVVHVPENIINEVDNLFFSFIWPKGKHHVKKCVLIQQIEDGGIKMPDIVSRIKALKATWIKRLCLSDNKYTNLAKAILKIEDFYRFVQCKYDAKYMDNVPPFYKQIFQSWYELYCLNPVTIDEISHEILWLNRQILIGNKPVIFKEWRNAGIETIADILDNQKRFLSTQDLERKFGLQIDVMKYNSLKSSIPKSWMKLLKSQNIVLTCRPNNIELKVNNIKKPLVELKCKDFYWEFVKKKYEKPTCVNKWREIFPNLNFDWEQIYKLPYTVARETFLQSFQYQIINRYLPCNSILHKWCKEPSDKYNFCDDIDNIKHYI